MLELRNVSYSYEGVEAVRDVTLRLEETQLVALAGPNGSGKSTLLKLMARVVTPRAGELAFGGKRLRDWPPREYAKQVGYLPQEPDPAFPMRAIDLVVTGRAPFLSRFAWESSEDYEAAEGALGMCDASHLADRYLDEMSGGERKRVFLARVLAGAPKLILLDEPLAALDISHVQQVSALLRGIVDRTGCTVVFASHDLNWAAAYSDRMLVMRDGALALDATPEEVMQPEAMRELFGFEASAVEVGGRSWIVPRT
ncbi:MAG TPA: ABC transporter ATP-binding protein [Thermoanaerobaculia bacterium]|nr:ABC transporter ATP-binding protein [Thermoanaerobaculia bacterium]